MVHDGESCPLCRQISICMKTIIPHGIKYQDTCSICWEDMIYPKDRNLGTFEECGHTFHNKCIQTWMHSNRESMQVVINHIEYQTSNPSINWRFDIELNLWVLVDTRTGYLSWQDETPISFIEDYTPIWLNYPRFVRYRRKWILVPNETIHLYTCPPTIPESFIPNGTFNTWIFDDDLSYYVLVNNESGYLSWQEDIPEINFSGYTPHWIDSPDKYHKRWILLPDIDPETLDSDEYYDSD